jgi:hypothetical protein
LQKALLTEGQQPKADDMYKMSHFLGILERMDDLSANAIRTTKINTALKKIKKLHEIPNDGKFQFKERVTSLLERWKDILQIQEQHATIAEDSSEAASLPTGIDLTDSCPLGTGSELLRQPTNRRENEPIFQGERTATPPLTLGK